MSLYNRMRWLILDLAAIPHALVIGMRMHTQPRTKWLHDRPDWVIKLIALRPPSVESGFVHQKVYEQALTELSFRRSTGVTK